jgi:hypothetical protein
MGLEQRREPAGIWRLANLGHYHNSKRHAICGVQQPFLIPGSGEFLACDFYEVVNSNHRNWDFRLKSVTEQIEARFSGEYV